MPYTESVGTERHNLRRMVTDGFKRESKVSPLCSVNPNFKLARSVSLSWWLSIPTKWLHKPE